MVNINFITPGVLYPKADKIAPNNGVTDKYGEGVLQVIIYDWINSCCFTGNFQSLHSVL